MDIGINNFFSAIGSKYNSCHSPGSGQFCSTMNGSAIVGSSQIGQMGIEDTAKNVGSDKTFGDYKATISQTIEKIDALLPKMKAAGTDMKKASNEVDGLFRNMVRKAWGSNETSFYTNRNGNKVIVNVTARNLDDISKKISDFVANY